MPSYTSTTIINAAPLTINTAFPSANNIANTAALNVALATATRSIVTLSLQASWPALAAHSNANYTVNMVLQHSSDNSNWANTNPMSILGLVGVTTNGANADQYRIPLARHFENYVRLSIAVPNGGPNLTNKEVGLSLVSA
jgi:hypothetical protein